MRLMLTVILLALLSTACGGELPVREPPSEEPPPLTYLSLGDSLAVGVGASDPDELGYTPLYRDRLAEATGREVELVNLGVSGETSSSMIGESGDSQLDQAVRVLRESPEAVVTLSIGGNDLLRVRNAPDAARREALDRFGWNLNYILRTLRRASESPPEIVVLTLYNPAPGTITDPWTGRMNETIRAVAGRHGASVARADRAFEGRERQYTHFGERPDIHPTDAGYRALADELLKSTDVEQYSGL
ncbi:SGNH/GDSL hydrolase family protein [Rubrobacter taiwanensis]|jgi:acyl-CoA thioesterase-1|uniref:SGNH/GDSL hydrolase family protein n=1 Tax=Rubrobacter taiwanensis TaxID=185139 RepID=A0A4R1B9X2_9ACTN|nr:SGNH/GDSL hydrolase family protein [Rubrobacter taiwanensis]TCJ13698.1 SGNH/GDSL hydrolase family protein [Rubrobacter taiwanensis]